MNVARQGQSADEPAWQVELIVPRSALAIFENVLAAADAVSSEAEGDDVWRVRAIFRAAPPLSVLEASIAIAATAVAIPAPQVRVEPLVDRDWVVEGLRHLDRVVVDRFAVRGKHLAPFAKNGVIELVVDAGRAFGTGHHETTAGCLAALGALARKRRFRRPLDLGCGTGLLALGMARLWHVPILAVDIDPLAVAIARANAKTNHLGPWLSTVTGDGLGSRAVRRAAPFDLVVANILARPLMAMAPSLSAALAPDGITVLSGFLIDQERSVINAYRRCGLRLVRREFRSRWVTLVMVKPAARPHRS